MARIFNPIKVEYFKSILQYNPQAGTFMWLEDRGGYLGKAQGGATAGTVRADGYIVIGIDGTQYRAHVLAWWFMTGTPVPKDKDLDHKDRDRSNNRWQNLCLKTRSRNNHNANPGKSNKSGVRGVSWRQNRNTWICRLYIDRRIIHVGEFKTFSDAVAARIEAEKTYLGESPTEQTGSIPIAPGYTPEIKVNRMATAEGRQEHAQKTSLTVRSTNTSGYPGVRLHKQSGLWHARIVINYKETSLGYFKTKEEAIVARKAAEEQRFCAT